MRTGIRSALFLAVLMATVNAFAQDTVKVKPFERYWTKPRIVPRAGFGAQEAAFFELGISYHKIYVHPLSLASLSPYLSVDVLIKEDEPIFGPKLGYELTAGLFGIAADITYYTDFDKDSWTVTPKAGISLLGFANLFYGVNLDLTDESFSIITKNRLSLVFNINKDYFNLKEARRRNLRIKN